MARGLPVFSETCPLPAGVCFLATTSDTFPLVLFNMATA